MTTITDMINRRIRDGAPMTLMQIAETELEAWVRSPRYAEMQAGQHYYESIHDILKSSRQVVGPGGQLIPAPNVSDNHIIHPFVAELVDQKTQYLLGKPYALQCDDTTYLDAVVQALGEGFRGLLVRVAREAVNKGIGWAQIYYDEHGRFGVKRIPAEELLPLWADAEHTVLDGVIRRYAVEVYEGRHKTIRHKIEFWTLSGVEHYEQRDGVIRPDPDAPSGGMMANARGEAYNWERLPFVALKYNDSELPLLRRVKTLVDEYDRVVSGDSNTLMDQPNSIMVLRNYDGADLGEARRNLAVYRAVKVSDEGGVDMLHTPVDVDASTKHLEQVRRDIYAFGRGVDTRNERLSGSPSGVALKHEYAQLDLDCNQLEDGVQAFFREVLWFVSAHLGTQPKEIKLTLNRDIIISEEAAVTMCAQSKGVVSDETILANHPWVDDVEAERARLAADAVGQYAYPGDDVS